MKLLTIKEAAEAIRMSEGYIKAAIRNDDLPVVQFGRVRGRRIRLEDLEEFVRRKIAGTTLSHEQEMTALAKMSTSLNQWVTPHDRP